MITMITPLVNVLRYKQLDHWKIYILFIASADGYGNYMEIRLQDDTDTDELSIQ